MLHKLICSQFLFFLLTAGVIYAQAEIEFKEVSYDFGEIREGTVADHQFVFTNIGDQPLIISSVKASCGCTTPYWTKEPVMPGKTGVIKASYNSRNRPGSFNKSITITSNARHATKMVYIKGVAVAGEQSEPIFTAEELRVAPKIDISNKFLQLGKVQLGNSQKFLLKVNNSGISPLQIKGIYSSCQCLQLHQGNSVEINPTSQGILELDFIPHKLGHYSYDAQVLSNDPLQPRYKITIEVEIVSSQTSSIIKETPSKITF